MKARRNGGLSLVELLVAMSIGLVMVGASAALYLRSAQSYRQLEALSRLQENARYGFELMGYDLRMAGNTGCLTPTLANYVSNRDANWWSRIRQPMQGYEESADGNAAGDSGLPADFDFRARVLRGDVISVLRANTEENTGVVGDYKLDNKPIPFTGSGFRKGGLLLLTDCSTQTVLFRKTGPDAIGGAIEHAAGSPSGNCKDNLYAQAGEDCSSAGSKDFSDAKLLPLSANAYYLRASPRRYPNGGGYIPSLYRQALQSDGTTTAEELVSGVSDMQIVYGVDTSATADGVMDAYVDANGVNGLDSNPVNAWNRVQAVRVTLTLESEDSIASEPLTFSYGNSASATDRRLRRRYTATFGLRLRLQ